VTSPPPPEPVLLPAHCGTVAAAAVRDQLLGAARGDTAVDASAVESLGQAVLQLLLAAARDAAAAGRGFAILDPSSAFAGRVSRCGLAQSLGLAPEESVA